MIKVENVSKAYELDDGTKVTALKDVSFEVEEGEILGIMGKSGSGKTTLLRAIRGVEHIDEGSISVGKVKVTSESSQFYYNELKKETAIHLQRKTFCVNCMLEDTLMRVTPILKLLKVSSVMRPMSFWNLFH